MLVTSVLRYLLTPNCILALGVLSNVSLLNISPFQGKIFTLLWEIISFNILTLYFKGSYGGVFFGHFFLECVNVNLEVKVKLSLRECLNIERINLPIGREIQDCFAGIILKTSKKEKLRSYRSFSWRFKYRSF